MRVGGTLALAVAVLGASLAPVQAWHIPGIPTLDLVAFDTETYVAWRLYAPANTLFGVQVRGLEGNVSFATFATWEMRPDLAFSSLISPSWYSEGGSELHLQLPEPAGVVASQPDTSLVRTDWLYLAVDHERFEAGETIVLAMAGFDGPLRGEFELIGAEGVRLLARTQGPAFLHREPDFEGVVNALARAEEPVRRTVVEVKAAAGAARTEAATDHFYAAFNAGADLRNGNVGTTRISYDGPDGGESGRDWYIITAGRPGDYTFRIDLSADERDNTPACRAVVGTTCWRMPVWLVGADVAVP